ncbi:MAG: thioredoxin domain-containing protein [Woeseiaceae bacterium]|nr:thioredoxin domain-containing protein [Woeseiaceae bacterium]
MNVARAILLMGLWSFLTACGTGGDAPDVRKLADGAVAMTTPSGDIVVRVLREAPEDADRPPLVIGLHGYGMDERQMSSLVNIEPSVPHAYVAIRGFEDLDARGYAWFPVSAGPAGVTYDPNAVAQATDRVFDAAEAISAWLGTDPGRVYLVGFSQGATVSLSAALLRPSGAAGFVGFAGTLPAFDQSDLPQNAAPVLIGHGSRDPGVRPADMDLTVAKLINAGRRVELNVYPVPHVVSAAGRRDISRWIDDRENGLALASSAPGPLSSVGVAVANSQGSTELLVDNVLQRAVSRGGVSGNPDGAVSVYKFFDYNCPSCRTAHRELPSLLAAHANVRLVAVDVPVFGDGSTRATAVTFSIDDPAHYKAAYSELMAKAGRIGASEAIDVLATHTGELIADTDVAFLVETHKADMQNNIAAMNVLGIVGTPGFVVVAKDEVRTFIGWDADALAGHLASLAP